MMGKIIFRVHESIAIIQLNNPPVNAMDWELRKDLLEAVYRAELDPSVKVIIISGSQGTFSAGADVHELFSLDVFKAPDFQSLCLEIESCTKPVICAIEGVAFGGGLEIVEASHYRIAKSGTKVGQLEITMGIHPGGGSNSTITKAFRDRKGSQYHAFW